MKQCIRCDREYPDTMNFCEMDGAYLLSLDELSKLPQGVCPDCDGIGQMVNLTGERIIVCKTCGGSGKVQENRE
jgi:DNA-directed RNA polymerase subunit RPC12/RpoP